MVSLTGECFWHWTGELNVLSGENFGVGQLRRAASRAMVPLEVGCCSYKTHKPSSTTLISICGWFMSERMEDFKLRSLWVLWACGDSRQTLWVRRLLSFRSQLTMANKMANSPSRQQSVHHRPPNEHRPGFQTLKATVLPWKCGRSVETSTQTTSWLVATSLSVENLRTSITAALFIIKIN